MSDPAARCRAAVSGDIDALQDDNGGDPLAALKADNPGMVHVHTARHPHHLRRLFVLYRTLHDAGVWEGDHNSFLTWAKLETGHVEGVVGPTGRIFRIPKSISFEAMPEDTFSRWWDRVVYLIFDRLLDKDQVALRSEISGVCDDDLGRRARECGERHGRAA